jgi:uncharacterized protein (TIGR03084 family)
LPEVVSALADEHDELDALVDGLDEEAWGAPTPAEGWAVRDQLSHLAFFDQAAAEAIGDPAGFATRAAAAVEAYRRTGADPMAEHLARGRSMTGAEILAWWRRARRELLQAARTLRAGERLAWFGPDMGALSFVSARLMETWAHGQDVADALGVERAATSRLMHVAQLGVRTRRFSYAVRGLEPPTAAVVVELEGPAGERWSWDEDAGGAELVRGPALDFCLVVTQRRNLADTSLEVHGDEARRWMSIAQAFAGPPGPGRPPSPGPPPRARPPSFSPGAGPS